MTNDKGEFVLFIKPKDKNGKPLFKYYGWFNASITYPIEDNRENYITPFLSQAQRFADKERGHGSPEDWIDFLMKDHPLWNITFKYINKFEIFKNKDNNKKAETNEEKPKRHRRNNGKAR